MLKEGGVRKQGIHILYTLSASFQVFGEPYIDFLLQDVVFTINGINN